MSDGKETPAMAEVRRMAEDGHQPPFDLLMRAKGDAKAAARAEAEQAELPPVPSVALATLRCRRNELREGRRKIAYSLEDLPNPESDYGKTHTYVLGVYDRLIALLTTEIMKLGGR